MNRQQLIDKLEEFGRSDKAFLWEASRLLKDQEAAEQKASRIRDARKEIVARLKHGPSSYYDLFYGLAFTNDVWQEAIRQLTDEGVIEGRDGLFCLCAPAAPEPPPALIGSMAPDGRHTLVYRLREFSERNRGRMDSSSYWTLRDAAARLAQLEDKAMNANPRSAQLLDSNYDGRHYPNGISDALQLFMDEHLQFFTSQAVLLLADAKMRLVAVDGERRHECETNEEDPTP
jgi:hypothetical protein